MNLILFIIILISSFIIVRIGAIAFEITGLEWSLAKFQALSCFTGTGFTTRESELVTGNQQRRRIASVLIVLGHAGLVTLIATFANSLRTDVILPNFKTPFLHSIVPTHLLPWMNLLIIIVTAYIIYQIFTHTRFAAKFTDALRSHIVKKDIIKPVTFEELVVATGGYGISSIEIRKDSSVLKKEIRNTDLRKHDITILAIERRGSTIPNPSADSEIMLGDRLICFGKLENIRRELCVNDF